MFIVFKIYNKILQKVKAASIQDKIVATACEGELKTPPTLRVALNKPSTTMHSVNTLLNMQYERSAVWRCIMPGWANTDTA